LPAEDDGQDGEHEPGDERPADAEGADEQGCDEGAGSDPRVAEDLERGEPEPGETEQLAVRTLPLAEAIEWARDGRITDVVSIAGLLRLAVDAAAGTRVESSSAPCGAQPSRPR
jgi:hypothetical protein